MPVDLPGSKPKGKGGLMGKRIAGVPAPLLLAGVALAIGVGLYLRHRSASTSATASTAAPAAGDTGTGSGGASGSGTTDQSNPDLTPIEDLANQLAGLTYLLGGSGGSFAATPDTSSPLTVTPAPTGATTTTSAPAPAAVSPAAPRSTSAVLVPKQVSGSGTTSLTSFNLQPSLPGKVSGSGPATVNPSGVMAVGSDVLSGASAAEIPQAPTGQAVAAPVYGVTSGPPAGQRASSNKKQGVYTVH